MTAEEYETQYQDALRECRTHSKRVGTPYRTHGGIRSVHINGFPCIDRLVFKEAYGEQLADKIMWEYDQGQSSPR